MCLGLTRARIRNYVLSCAHPEMHCTCTYTPCEYVHVYVHHTIHGTHDMICTCVHGHVCVCVFIRTRTPHSMHGTYVDIGHGTCLHGRVCVSYYTCACVILHTIRVCVSHCIRHLTHTIYTHGRAHMQKHMRT
jgi:hypothetical protein